MYWKFLIFLNFFLFEFLFFFCLFVCGSDKSDNSAGKLISFFFKINANHVKVDF